MSDDHLQNWSRFVAALPAMLPWVRRGVALETCVSTQEECWSRSGGEAGVLVTAFTQTGGRGQHGRRWEQSPTAGIAVTVGLPAAAYPAGVLPVAAGLAAAEACRRWIVGSHAATVGVKWPNDVVGLDPASGRRLKLAGVLVEVRDGVALVGIGVNVRQGPEDFPEPVRGVAGSIRMLSEADERLSRLDVLGTLLVELGALLDAGPAGVRERWRELDALVGTVQSFETARGPVRGRVLRLDPLEAIVLETAAGVVTLPAATTRVARDVAQGAGS